MLKNKEINFLTNFLKRIYIVIAPYNHDGLSSVMFVYNVIE